MQSGFKLSLREVPRYRGKWGHWSWVAHRLSGLAILLYLIIHVWDTANATFWPEAYGYMLEVFKWLPFSLGEVALMAAVLFHAFNGIRVALLDFKPEWWQYQKQSAIIVWSLFILTFLPLGYLMIQSTVDHCQELAEAGGSCLTFPTP